VTDDSNAGQRNDQEPTPQESTQEPTPQEIEAAKVAKDIADGHRYVPQEMRDAKDKKAERPKKAARPAKAADAKPGERIAKVLARAGIASRREIERLIGLGLVAVNGRILDTPATLVKATDIVTVEGKRVGKAEPTRVWRYHKPVGLMTTERDPQGRPTVFDDLPKDLPRVLKVGRLDLNSEGLLLLTNDGELARALELPSTGWIKRYRVRALGHTTQQRLDALKDGTTVDGVIYGPIEATLDKVAEKADGRANVWISVAITEGKNREVRKVMESIGLKVNRLIRLAYGPFQLGNLEPGEVEEVGPRVVRELLGDMISPRNLPPEDASQTLSRPARPAGDMGAPQGRRSGSDRFAGKSDFKPRAPRRDFAEKRDFKDRDFDHRPRFEGDGEARNRKPARSFDDRPRKPYVARTKPGVDRDGIPHGEAGAYERAKREFGGGERQSSGRQASERPKHDFKPRSEGERPSFKTPYRPRRDDDAQASGERPQRDFKPRAEGDRPRFKKSYTPRGEGGAYAGDGERPKRDFKPRSEGERPSFKKPYRPRRKDEAQASGGDRPQRDFKPRAEGDRPRFKKPYTLRAEGGDYSATGERPKRAWKPREEGSDRPAQKSYAKKPYAAREGGDRKGFGDRPKPGGFKGKPGGGGGRPGWKPKSTRG